jgi:hypothetical protein
LIFLEDIDESLRNDPDILALINKNKKWRKKRH